MPLVSMTEMLNKAKAEGYAVGQFNLNNLEFTQAILQAAEEEKSPVILGVSEGAARYMSGFKTVVKWLKVLWKILTSQFQWQFTLTTVQALKNVKKRLMQVSHL